jgi:predicted nuclease of predicted toxin-antitoxin system
VKFLVDMPLSPAVAQWLLSNGHDAVHASTIGLASASDVEIISRATQDGRIIVTADLDYPRLLALGDASGPALILFRGGVWKEDQVIDRLVAVMAAIPEPELSRSLVVVEKSRIRRRRLPL